MGWTWELIAQRAQEKMGCFVNWDERFFICPDCGEQISETNWMGWWNIEKSCPICRFDFFEEDM